MIRLANLVAPWPFVAIVLVVVAGPLLLLGELVTADSGTRIEQAERAATADAATRAADLLHSRVTALSDAVFGVGRSSELSMAADDDLLHGSHGSQRLLETYREALSSDVARMLIVNRLGEVIARLPASEVVPASTDYLPPSAFAPSSAGNFSFQRVTRIVTHSSDQPGLMLSIGLTHVTTVPMAFVVEVPVSTISDWITPAISETRAIHVRDEQKRLVASAGSVVSRTPLTPMPETSALAPTPTAIIAASPVRDLAWDVVAVREPLALTAFRAASDGQRAVRVMLLGLLAVAAYAVGAFGERLRRRERELSEANARVRAASEAKSKFLAVVSHDLRTPLNAIIGFSDVLLQRLFGDLNDKQDEYLRDIRGAGEHQLTLVNDLLDLSKIEAGKMELHPVPFSLRELLQQTQGVVMPLAQAKHQRLELDVAADVPTVEQDPVRLRQVVLNLLSNAVKFTPDGGIVRTVARSHDGLITLAVSDTGVGISPEDQTKVFEEFQQVGATSRSGQGTGLGLALVRGFVRMMGGEVTLRSVVGEGSTFSVTLPERQPAV